MSMEPPDYQKYLVLFVDDEDKSRKYFKRLFGNIFRIVLASDGLEALDILRQRVDEIGLIVTDQKMPTETGVKFLEKAAKLKPSLVRILSTAFADIDSAIDSVNKGGVYRYVTKPWDVGDFEVTLRRAMEYYLLQADRDALVQQRINGLESLALNDRVLSLAALATIRDGGLRHVGEALVGLSQLHAACSNARGEPVPLHQVAWAELYKRHHAFLAKATALLPKKLSACEELAYEKPVSASAVLASAVKNTGKFKISASAGADARWPGPEAVVTEQVKNLFAGINGALAESDVVPINTTSSGLELHLPESAVLGALEPFFGSSAAPLGEAGFALVSSFLGFAHAGGTFEIQPDIGSSTVCLRLGFSPSRVNSPVGDSIETIASDLIGNELFWSRNV